MHDDSEALYQRLMNGEIAFNTDEYGALVNSIEIEKCADPIEKLLAMSVSNNHTVTMALAFILRETLSREFVLAHVPAMRQIFRNAIAREYWRASYDLSEQIFDVPFTEIEYQSYLHMIHSDNCILQNKAIQNLFYLPLNQFNTLATVTNEYDFSLFMDDKYLPTEQWFANKTLGKSLAYQKIILTALYKHGMSKAELYNISGGNSADIFEYIFMYLPDAMTERTDT